MEFSRRLVVKTCVRLNDSPARNDDLSDPYETYVTKLFSDLRVEAFRQNRQN